MKSISKLIMAVCITLSFGLYSQKYYVPGYLIKKTSTGEIQFFDPTGGKVVPTGWSALSSSSGSTIVSQGSGFAANSTGVGLPGQVWYREGKRAGDNRWGYIYTSSLSDTLLIGLQANNALVTGDAKLYLPAGATISLGGLLIGSQQDYGSKGIIRIGNKSKKTKTEETGEHNIAIGHDALKNATEAESNVAIGTEAGSQVQGGKNNTYVGFKSGLNNIAGHYNTFLGRATGFNALGKRNTFLGSEAGYGDASASNKYGDYNTYVGTQSGYSNQSGAENTFVGYRAGFSNQLGKDNVAIGDSAGYNIIKGENTIVGSDIKGLATDQNVLRIGAGGTTYIHGNSSGNIGIGIDANTDNKLYIKGSSYLDGKVGIGMAPSTDYALHVKGVSAFTSQVKANKILPYGSDKDIIIGSAADKGIIFQTSSGSTSYYRMKIINNGNVGIGTTDPQSTLDIKAGGAIRVDSLYSHKNTQLIVSAGNSTSENGAIHFRTKNNTRLSIANNGNVGIGITAPTHILHLKRSADNDTFLKLENTKNSKNVGLYLVAGGTVSSGIATGFAKIYMDEKTIIQSRKGGNNLRFITDDKDVVYINQHQQFGIGLENFKFDNDNLKLQVVGTSFFKGNMGVGIAAHVKVNSGDRDYKLKVQGNVMTKGVYSENAQELTIQSGHGATSESRISFNTNNNTRMVVSKDGYVGIGTIDPKAPLHVGTYVTKAGIPTHIWAVAGENKTTNRDFLGPSNNVDATGGDVSNAETGNFPGETFLQIVKDDTGDFIIHDNKGGVSIVARGSIKSYGAVVASASALFSDARKKINLGVSDRAEDLETLQQIRITNYVKKDPSERHHHIEKKVIAQEVEEVYPIAVNQMVGLVPDVFQRQSSSSLEGTTLRVAIDSIGDLKQGDELKLLVFRDTDQSEFLHEIERVPLTKLEGKELSFTLSQEQAEQLSQQPFKVLVYGRHVKDMRTVDYDAIAMLNVSATQALADNMDRLTNRIETLESSIVSREILIYFMAILLVVLTVLFVLDKRCCKK